MTRILSALFLFLAAPFAVADPPAHVVRIGTPKIVAIPSSAAPAPPAGAPVNLDSGKFLWLDVTGYDGNIEWDFSLPGSTVIPSDASAKYWGGVKQGESSPRWHSIPEGVIPFAGTTKTRVSQGFLGSLRGRKKANYPFSTVLFRPAFQRS